jgi:hypothetical protein
MRDLDPYLPAPARVRCWLAGGKDYYAADRLAGEGIVAARPHAALAALACREFERRALMMIAERNENSQYLILGSELDAKSHRHVHEAQPQACIVYVDDDPMVLTHGRAWTFNCPGGPIEWIDGNLTCWRNVLDAATHEGVLDLRKPIVVTMTGTTEYLHPNVPAAKLVQEMFATLAPGSALILCQTVLDGDPERFAHLQHVYESFKVDYTPRFQVEVEEFFTGLELLDPGIVPPHRWWPNGPFDAEADGRVSCLAGVGVKPV